MSHSHACWICVKFQPWGAAWRPCPNDAAPIETIRERWMRSLASGEGDEERQR